MSQQAMHLLGALGLLGLAWWHAMELFIAWYSGMEAEIPGPTWWTMAAVSSALAAAALPLLWSAVR